LRRARIAASGLRRPGSRLGAGRPVFHGAFFSRLGRPVFKEINETQNTASPSPSAIWREAWLGSLHPTTQPVGAPQGHRVQG
jgi:hypothetical protein